MGRTQVTVERIYFNYYQSDMNLGFAHPEYGMNVMPEDLSKFPVAPYNSVAYAMDVTRGQTLKVHALLKGPPNRTVKIRTVQPKRRRSALLNLLRQLGISPGEDAHFDRMLGDVHPTTVKFDKNGNSIGVKFQFQDEYSALVELPLKNADVWSRGVYASWQLWKWEFSDDRGATWRSVNGLINKDISVHRVFATKSIASWPWTSYDEEVKMNAAQVPYISNPPYTGALEWACRWAEGETTEHGIATRITEHINTCDRFKYAESTVQNYTSKFTMVFDCARFIDRLNGKFGRGPNVNCVDCAHMVLSLANALGCKLKSGRIRNGNESLKFDLNPVYLIGYDRTDVMKNFYYHQVAVSTNGEDIDEYRVYDACIRFGEKIYHKLKVEAPRKMKRLLNTPALKEGHPANIPLGRDAFAFGYLSVLVKPEQTPSQTDMTIKEGQSELWSVSSFKFY